MLFHRPAGNIFSLCVTPGSLIKKQKKKGFDFKMNICKCMKKIPAMLVFCIDKVNLVRN